MSSESVCQVARSWVDVGSFHTRLVVRFMIFTASVRNTLDTPSYFFSSNFETDCGAHPASYSVGIGVLFLGLKWSCLEADHSHLLSRL
jgi:hypothetical protein